MDLTSLAGGSAAFALGAGGTTTAEVGAAGAAAGAPMGAGGGQTSGGAQSLGGQPSAGGPSAAGGQAEAGGTANAAGAAQEVIDPELAAQLAAEEEAASRLPIDALSDEFADAATLSEWLRIEDVEVWAGSQLEVLDFDTTYAGGAFLRPYTSSWDGAYRGPLVFKNVTGDFVITSHVNATQRGDLGPPQSSFSLAGLMMRAPNAVTPGGENYVFLSLGSGDGGAFQTEIKVTAAGVSSLEVAPAEGPEARIRVARIGSYMIGLLEWPGEGWHVHRRVVHGGLPRTLQVGMTAYTDWDTVSTLDPATYNQQVIVNGNADLDARYDYVRFTRPDVPAALVDADLTNVTEVTDAELIAFLGFDDAE